MYDRHSLQEYKDEKRLDRWFFARQQLQKHSKENPLTNKDSMAQPTQSEANQKYYDKRINPQNF